MKESALLVLARVQAYTTAFAYLNGGIYSLFYQNQINESSVSDLLDKLNFFQQSGKIAIAVAILIIFINIYILKKDPSKTLKILVGICYLILGLISVFQFTLTLPGSFLLFTAITIFMTIPTK